MAEAARNEKRIAEDEHVRRLLPDAKASAPRTITLRGFVGKSPVAGSWRLYLNPELSEYVEVDEDDILMTSPIEKSEDPRGGTLATIKRTAELKYTCVTTAEAEAQFLDGNITSTFLAGTATSPGGTEGVAPRATPSIIVATFLYCVPTIVSIISATGNCGTQTFRCRSTISFCGGCDLA